jgi:hypothetical protein
MNFATKPLGAKTVVAEWEAVIAAMMRLLDNVPTWGEKPDSPSGGAKQKS